MRFLRMLTNALLAGALGAAYLTILLLQLNPQVPLASGSVWRWYLTLAGFYGVHLALVFYVVMLLREFVSFGAFSPGWISVRLLAWLSATAAAVASLLMWLNLRGFPYVFDEAAARRFAFGAGATTVAAVVLLGIAVAHYSSGRRGSRVGAALLAIAITGSLALPIAARGAGGEPPLGARRVALATAPPRATARIILLLLDGASLEYVWPRVAAARLPNFGRLLDAGASMDLATIRPTQPDPVWAAVATGMYPSKNGVRSASSYFAPGDHRAVDLLPAHCFSHVLVRLGVVQDRPNTSAAWRARPLWSILGDYGISAGVVRWPLTYPAQPLTGFMVTDRFHQMVGSMFEFDGRAAYPDEIVAVAREAFNANGSAAADAVAASARRDEAYARAAREIRATTPVEVEAIRYQAIDAASHVYLRYAEGSGFGDVTAAERERFGPLMDRYYAYVDGEIGAAVERLAPGDLLLVVSGFGMQPVGPVKHAAARVLRDPEFSGTHEYGPDGFLLAYGSSVTPGRRRRGSVVDVTPTILYYLGLPIGRDMDGFARADLFDERFTAAHPIAYIPSHGR
ncbi:MAG TPA: alkaline phosphatase family protein [Vicinamibacterales bacterium]|nr:alkaline phosphatase family protein [Vicinamibacterales bacterium]